VEEVGEIFLVLEHFLNLVIFLTYSHSQQHKYDWQIGVE